MSQPQDFPRRFLSLWMPNLPTDRVQRCAALLDRNRPLVLVAKMAGAQRLMAVDRKAHGAGLVCGMGLAQARAMEPALQVLPYEPDADARCLEAIADWADRYTPLVGRTRPDGLVLDITGAAHLLGGEVALRKDLLGRIARLGFTATAAIAPTPGAAWAFARYGGPSILPTDVSRAALDETLACLPVAGLRLAPETVAALIRVGLKRIGDLIGRPRGALAARFGAAVILRLDQARGIDSEAIDPRQPVPPAEVEMGFVEPILTTDAVARACQDLAGRLSTLLAARGEGATGLALAVWRVDGLVKRIDVRLASPCRHADTMAGLLALRLGHLDDPLDPGFGYDLVRLSAAGVAVSGPEACPLPGVVLEVGPAEFARARDALLDRLTARFGADRVSICEFAKTHIPERAARLVSVSDQGAGGGLDRVMVRPVHAGARQTDRRAGPHQSGPLSRRDIAPVALSRPLRLLDPPEPVEVMAEVPDGPPMHMRWRRRPLRIVAADGPERVAPEWWLPAALSERGVSDRTRDYWRIEDASGRRLWLYREGSYGAPDPFKPPRWYVHGLFA